MRDRHDCERGGAGLIRSDNGKPWFGRARWIGFDPITWEGWLVSALAAVLFFGLGFAEDSVDENSWQSWLLMAAMLAVVATYATIIYRKIEGEF
ncbi:MAG TPA: hypothetical protein VF757_07630 [Sphingomicrobium sp.]